MNIRYFGRGKQLKDILTDSSSLRILTVVVVEKLSQLTEEAGGVGDRQEALLELSSTDRNSFGQGPITFTNTLAEVKPGLGPGSDARRCKKLNAARHGRLRAAARPRSARSP